MENKKREIAEFYKQVLSDLKLKEKIVEKAKKITNEEDLKKLIREEIMPMMKKYSVNISKEELLAYEQETLKELSEDALESVSGGLSVNSSIAGGVLALTLMAGGAMALGQSTYAEAPGNTSSITIQDGQSDKENDDILQKNWDFNFLLNFINENSVDSVLEEYEDDKSQAERFLQKLNDFINANNTNENTAAKLKEIVEYRNSFETKMKNFSFNGSDDKENVDWSFKDGTLNIFTDKAMQDKKWKKSISNDQIKKVTLGHEVTSIGDGTFTACTSLTQINISSNSKLTSIGNYAFFLCFNLTQINIPHSVTSIGNSAFDHCSNLIQINIPSSVTSIGKSAFDHCRHLTQINIPDSVTSIGNNAFNSCNRLTQVNFSPAAKLTSIGEHAFYGCNSLTQISIPNSLASIGGGAFFGCSSLSQIDIPSGVTSIGDGTFATCDSLTQINFSSNSKLTSIGNDAFSRCSNLTKINIPSSVTLIGKSAFNHCINLTQIIIPSSVTKILGGAFADCDNLQLVNFKGLKDPSYGYNKFFNNYVFSNENVKIVVPLHYEGKTFCGLSVTKSLNEDNADEVTTAKSLAGEDDDDDNNNKDNNGAQNNDNNAQEIMNNVNLGDVLFWSMDENGILYVCENAKYPISQHESGRGVRVSPIFINSGAKEWVAPAKVTSKDGQKYDVIGTIEGTGSLCYYPQQLEHIIKGATKNMEDIETIKLQNGTKWFDFYGLNDSGLKIKTIDCSDVNDSSSTIVFPSNAFDGLETLEKIIMPTKSKETVFFRNYLKNSSASCLENSTVKEVVVPLNAERDERFLSLEKEIKLINSKGNKQIKLTVEAQSVRDNVTLAEGELWGEDSNFNQYICRITDHRNNRVSIIPVFNNKKFIVPSQIFVSNNNSNSFYSFDNYDRYYVNGLSLAKRDGVSTDGIEEITFERSDYHNFRLSDFQNSNVTKVDCSKISKGSRVIFESNSFANNSNVENILLPSHGEVCFYNNCFAGTKIKSLNLSGNVTICEGAFKGSGLSSVSIDSNETKLRVSKGAFEGTKMKELVVPKNSNSIHLDENIGVNVVHEGQPTKNFITSLSRSVTNLAKSVVNFGKRIIGTFWK